MGRRRCDILFLFPNNRQAFAFVRINAAVYIRKFNIVVFLILIDLFSQL